MAATLAKVLHGGRSGLSSGMLPAVVRRVQHEGLLPQANPAVGTHMGRLIHTSQWRNPMLYEGGSIKAPRKMEQFCSKRWFMRSKPGDNERLPPEVRAVVHAGFVASMLGAIMTLPTIYRAYKGLFTVYKK